MVRKLINIIAQLRRDIANDKVECTLLQTEDLAKLCDAAERKRKPKKLRKPSEEAIDRAVAAFDAETARWCWRRGPFNEGFELVRNSSPKNDINADEYFQIVKLTKRECVDRHEAEGWCNTYRGRAAMLAALEVL